MTTHIPLPTDEQLAQEAALISSAQIVSSDIEDDEFWQAILSANKGYIFPGKDNTCFITFYTPSLGF